MGGWYCIFIVRYVTIVGMTETGSTDNSVRTPPQPQLWEKIAAVVAAFLILCLVGFLLVRNRPIQDPNLVVALRYIIAVMAAVFGGTLPGFLNVSYTWGGLACCRTAGAFACFFITMTLILKCCHRPRFSQRYLCLLLSPSPQRSP